MEIPVDQLPKKKKDLHSSPPSPPPPERNLHFKYDDCEVAKLDTLLVPGATL